MYPEVHEWLDFLNNQDIKITSDTYFIGHSLGCITIARYLEKLPTRAVAQACIFVAGFCNIPKVPLLIDFCQLPLDYSEVRNHAKEFFVISSDNDDFLSFKIKLLHLDFSILSSTLKSKLSFE
jgi:predicted alpha/beta hydrolase family esterase